MAFENATDFLVDVQVQYYTHEQHQRYGQFLMNSLFVCRPDLATKLNGTEVDCFFSDEKVGATIEWLTKNWRKTANARSKPLKCDDCGETKPDVEEGVCPYVEELYNRQEPATLCRNCHRERAADI